MAEHSGPVRRTPRAQVRRRLLDEAARAFAEHGYDDARIDDIAHAAGFTKGAVYSNFGGKQGLFAAILDAGADAELQDVMAGIDDGADRAAVLDRVARMVARRIVDDTGRAQLGLEFAARAGRDESTREVLAPLRRAQRDAASRSIGEVAERTGARPSIDPELAALILHCLTNGLTNERIADPETISPELVERALAAVLTMLLPPNDRPTPAPCSCSPTL